MNIFILTLLTLSIASSPKLKQATVLFRHGARNQIKDVYNLNVSKDLFGELTSVGIH